MEVDPQIITWRVETRFEDGNPTVFNQVSFRSDRPLGSLRLINYVDPNILGAGGDIVFTRGTPGQPDFRIFLLDDVERVGFGHGGDVSVSSVVSTSGIGGLVRCIAR